MSDRQSWAKAPSVALLLALTTVCALLWSRLDIRQQDERGLLLAESPARSGVELLVVFLGSATCPASAAQWMPATMERMQSSLRAQASALGHTVVFSGVALDQDIDVGLGFLRKMGRFNEVSVGRSWLNSLSIQYLLRDQAAEAAIPQVAVFSRNVTIDDEFLEVSPDRLIERRIGLDEIRAWDLLDFPLRLTESR